MSFRVGRKIKIDRATGRSGRKLNRQQVELSMRVSVGERARAFPLVAVKRANCYTLPRERFIGPKPAGRIVSSALSLSFSLFFFLFFQYR